MNIILALLFFAIFLLGFFFFLIKLIDAFILNRHRKKYETYDDPSRKGGELKKEFERQHSRFGIGDSNFERERTIERQELLPSTQVELRTKENSDLGGDKQKPKKLRVLRRRN